MFNVRFGLKKDKYRRCKFWRFGQLSLGQDVRAPLSSVIALITQRRCCCSCVIIAEIIHLSAIKPDMK